jgi:hypothetical protein
MVLACGIMHFLGIVISMHNVGEKLLRVNGTTQTDFGEGGFVCCPVTNCVQNTSVLENKRGADFRGSRRTDAIKLDDGGTKRSRLRTLWWLILLPVSAAAAAAWRPCIAAQTTTADHKITRPANIDLLHN